MCEKTFKLDLKDESYNNKEMYARKDLLKGRESAQMNQGCVLQRAHRKNPNEVTPSGVMEGEK